MDAYEHFLRTCREEPEKPDLRNPVRAPYGDPKLKEAAAIKAADAAKTAEERRALCKQYGVKTGMFGLVPSKGLILPSAEEFHRQLMTGRPIEITGLLVDYFLIDRANHAFVYITPKIDGSRKAMGNYYERCTYELGLNCSEFGWAKPRQPIVVFFRRSHRWFCQQSSVRRRS